ncbi:Hypothetical predicted protein [Xyrichtys novacula]|uniref:Uncharacterized protein n=1 Tax=Xyrichtys novacula TaxID=13765 RepID=A0AAV1H3P3_XYRNO|nr:Hypothetical predicted protein [Xyrichtys novacula]
MDCFLKRKAPQEPNFIDNKTEPQPTTSLELSSACSDSAPKGAKLKRTMDKLDIMDDASHLCTPSSSTKGARSVTDCSFPSAGLTD